MPGIFSKLKKIVAFGGKPFENSFVHLMMQRSAQMAKYIMLAVLSPKLGERSGAISPLTLIQQRLRFEHAAFRQFVGFSCLSHQEVFCSKLVNAQCTKIVECA